MNNDKANNTALVNLVNEHVLFWPFTIIQQQQQQQQQQTFISSRIYFFPLLINVFSINNTVKVVNNGKR